MSIERPRATQGKRNIDNFDMLSRKDMYLLTTLPVHYKEPIDQSRVLRLVFSAWAKGMGFKPIVIVANREGEDRELKSTGEELKTSLDRLPQNSHIATFAPSAAGPLTLTTMVNRDRLVDVETEYAIDQIFSQTRIERAVISCSRVRIGENGQKYIDGYKRSHKLYAQSLTQMDEFARMVDERVRLGILMKDESDVILGYVARGDVHVPEGTGVDTLAQIPYLVSKYKGHGKGIFLGSMFDPQVRNHLRGT